MISGGYPFAPSGRQENNGMKVRESERGIQIYDFTAVEAYKIARVIEREGIRFYRRLLDTTDDTKAQEVLGSLRNAEEDHLALFERLLTNAAGEAGDGDEDGLLDVVDAGIFSVPDSALAVADFNQALQLGIIIEKRSLAFYLEVEKHTESSEGKDALRKVIAEERQHWEQLKRLSG